VSVYIGWCYTAIPKSLIFVGVKVGFSILQHIAMHWMAIDLCL